MKNEKNKPKRMAFNLEAHWKTNFDYPFLGSHDFPILSPSGRDLVLTIKEFYREEVTNKDGESWCNVVNFVENVKPMIVNKVNFGNLQIAFGCENAKGFLDGKVSLYVRKGVWSFGKKVNALRFRDILPDTELESLKEGEIENAAKYFANKGHLKQWEQVRKITKDEVKQIKKLAKTIKKDADKTTD